MLKKTTLEKDVLITIKLFYSPALFTFRNGGFRSKVLFGAILIMLFMLFDDVVILTEKLGLHLKEEKKRHRQLLSLGLEVHSPVR